MKKLTLFLSMVAFVFAFGACSKPAPTNMIITEANNGKTVTVTKGDTVVITIESNRTTGYSWGLSPFESRQTEILQAVGDAAYTSPKDAPPGAAGIESFTFKTVNAGEQRIALNYRRPFENNTAPTKTFSVTVVVK